MLYRTIIRVIESGNTEGLSEKLDVFFLNNRLTEDEYKKLLDLINKEDIES